MGLPLTAVTSDAFSRETRDPTRVRRRADPGRTRSKAWWPGRNVLTLACDTGRNYLSTDLHAAPA